MPIVMRSGRLRKPLFRFANTAANYTTERAMAGTRSLALLRARRGVVRSWRGFAAETGSISGFGPYSWRGQL